MQTTVYIYRDADYVPVYVGVTDRRTRRMHEHASSKWWWHIVASAAYLHYEERALALRAEAGLIAYWNPIGNTQHRTGEPLRKPLTDADLGEMRRRREQPAASTYGDVAAARARIFAEPDIKRRRALWMDLPTKIRGDVGCVVCQRTRRDDEVGTWHRPTCPDCYTPNRKRGGSSRRIAVS